MAESREKTAHSPDTGSKHDLSPSKVQQEPDPKRIRPLNEKDPNVLSSNPTLPAVRATDFLHNKPETLITASDDMICTIQLTHTTHRKGKFFKERSAERVSLLKEHYVIYVLEVRQNKMKFLICLAFLL